MNGTRSTFELQDVLLLFGIERRTGELVIEAGNNIGSLIFHEGRILAAFSPYTRAIGDQLVEQGVISETELLSALKQQRSGPAAPLGKILMDQGKVTSEAIEHLVQEQIRKAISDFREWKPVEFNFVRKTIQPMDEIHLSVQEFLPPKLRELLQTFVKDMSEQQEFTT